MVKKDKVTKFYEAIKLRTREWMEFGYLFADAHDRAWTEFFNGYLIPRDYLEKKKVLSFQEAEKEGFVREE